MAGETQKLKRLGESIKNLSTIKKVAFVGLLFGSVFAIIYLFAWAQQPIFDVLYSNLDSSDSGAIIEKLKAQKIPYRITDGGSTILVPSDKVYELRIHMATLGITSGGVVGFELFDKTKLGITEFAQQVNYQRALQGELARTISAIRAVESARVHIVLPKKSVFLEEEEPARASVVLKIRGGASLSNAQAQGIVHLVASSVPGLSAERITIVDTSGKILAGAGKDAHKAGLSPEQWEYQTRYEKALEEKLRTMLENVLGPDKAIVRVSAIMDFSQVEKLEEKYDPKGVAVRSEQSRQSSQDLGLAGERKTPVAVTPVQPQPGSGEREGERPKAEDLSRTVNYEVSKVVSKIIEPPGLVKRLSVGVVVDGTYKTVKTKKGEVKEYVPRSETELNALKDLIRGALNLDANRGDTLELVNLQFQGRPVEQPEEVGIFERLRPLLGYGKYLLVILVAFLIYTKILKPILNWLLLPPSPEIELVKQLPLTVKELEAGIDAKREALAARLKEILQQDKEATSEVIKSWVTQGSQS